MKVKDITALMGNEVNLLLEDNSSEEFTVYDGKIMFLREEKYKNAEVEWIRPITNGIALRITT